MKAIPIAADDEDPGRKNTSTGAPCRPKCRHDTREMAIYVALRRGARRATADSGGDLLARFFTPCFFAAARNAAPYALFAQSTISAALSIASSGH